MKPTCNFEYTGRQSEDGRYIHRCWVCRKEWRSKYQDPAQLKANCSGVPEDHRLVSVPAQPFAAFQQGTTPRYMAARFPEGTARHHGTHVLTQEAPRGSECDWTGHRRWGVKLTISLAGVLTLTWPGGSATAQAPASWDGKDEEEIDVGNGIRVHTCFDTMEAVPR